MIDMIGILEIALVGNAYTERILPSIGQRVEKRSGKPFKSGLRVATVTGQAINLHTGKPGFTFAEDDSVVDIRICQVVP